MSSTCRLPAFAATAGNPVVAPDRPYQGSRRTPCRRIRGTCHAHFFATEKFPDTGMKFPDLLNIFPVNLRREFRKKGLRHSGFLLQNRLIEPQNWTAKHIADSLAQQLVVVTDRVAAVKVICRHSMMSGETTGGIHVTVVFSFVSVERLCELKPRRPQP
jgi:hypothetical protein